MCMHADSLQMVQILHGELEASLQATRAELERTEAELEKQRELNEKLENDLLQMDQRKPLGGPNGTASPAVQSEAGEAGLDMLAGLDLGKKQSVRLPLIECSLGGLTML